MPSYPIRLITTEDGSSSLYREDINETYHSFHGARAESDYVFIEKGLAHLHSVENAASISILEVGFGTGLNAFLSAIWASQHQVKVEYHTLEPIPIEPALYRQLNYGKSAEEKKLIQDLHTVSWGSAHPLSNYFQFTKYEQTLESFLLDAPIDLIYFDAFAPSKQPEVWAQENLQKCFDLLRKEGILVTYCAQGQFKRNLKTVGFEVEILSGALGKKEMVRARKPH